MSLLRLAAAVLVLSACGSAPARVTYDKDHCYLDGQAVQIEDVEVEQSVLAQRVLDRQPIQTGITLLILLIAGATYLDKLARLFSRQRHPDGERGPTMTARLRAVIDRQRQHPVRYFAIVSSTVTVILVGAGVYIYLDADRRASERALGQLQFCHLALKSAAEQAALDEQRKNLDQLSETAGSIKSLVNQLPPEEQRKAELLLTQMRAALGNQDKLLSRETAVAQAVAAGSVTLQKNLGALAADVGGLRPLPQRIKELTEALGRVDGHTVELQKRLDAVGQKVGEIDCARVKLPSGKTMGETIAELSSRPAPACRCECASTAARDGGTR